MTSTPEKRAPGIAEAELRLRAMEWRAAGHYHAMRSLLIAFTIAGLIPAATLVKAPTVIVTLLLTYGCFGRVWLCILLACLAVAAHRLSPLTMLVTAVGVFLMGATDLRRLRGFSELTSYQLLAISFGVLYSTLLSLVLAFARFEHGVLHVVLASCFLVRSIRQMTASQRLLPPRFTDRWQMLSEARITVLRRFSDENSQAVKNAILPLLQGYGSVVLVGDRTLEKARDRGWLSIDLSRMPGRLKMSECTFTDTEWREGVRRILTRTDVAVIDISEPTDNLIWELAQCYNLLPPHRILVLVGVDAPVGRSLEEHCADVVRRLEPYGVDPNARPRLIPYDAATGGGQFELGQHLLEAMKQLVEVDSPRTGGRAAAESGKAARG